MRREGGLISVLPTIERLGRDPSGATARAALRPPVAPIAAGALALVPVVALGLAEGGFYPRPWGWAALGLAGATAASLVLRRDASLARSALLLLGVLVALGFWIAASLAWTRSPGLSVLELQRLLVYLAGVAAAAVIVRAHTARALVVGVFLGTAALSTGGLVSYLVTRERAPDMLQGAYLHRPLGYANAMAIACVIAIVLGLGITVDVAPRRVRVAAAAALVPLTSALVLTGSRAAAGALIAGVAAVVALEPNRRRMLKSWRWILVLPALAVLAVSAFEPTNSRIVGAPGDDLGNRLLVVIAALTALAVPPALLATRAVAERGRGHAGRLPAMVAVVALASVIGFGAARFPGLAGDRPLFWRVAIEEFRERPLLGSGAGTYAQVWLERRPADLSVLDAHSVVAETLAELGIGGVALVCLLLTLPLVWARRARTSPLVPASGGAFAAYAVHASTDWDWEMPAITLAGLFCAVAVGVAADADRGVVRLSASARRAAVALSALAAAVALAGLAGASALEDARRSLARGDAAGAASAAGRSTRWQPWSVEGLLVEGQARLMLGDRRVAGVLFARAAAREPNDYRAWLALAAVTRGDVAEAAVLRARGLNPHAVRAVRGSPGRASPAAEYPREERRNHEEDVAAGAAALGRRGRDGRRNARPGGGGVRRDHRADRNGRHHCVQERKQRPGSPGGRRLAMPEPGGGDQLEHRGSPGTSRPAGSGRATRHTRPTRTTRASGKHEPQQARVRDGRSGHPSQQAVEAVCGENLHVTGGAVRNRAIPGTIRASHPSDGTGTGARGSRGWYGVVVGGSGPFSVYAICAPAGSTEFRSAGGQYGAQYGG